MSIVCKYLWAAPENIQHNRRAVRENHVTFGIERNGKNIINFH